MGATMRPVRLSEVPPRDVRPLLVEERAALLDLLGGLDATDWDRPSPCPGWSVQDVVAHVLGEDLGLLARGRDEHTCGEIPPQSTYRGLVDALNASNQQWVAAARRLSPRQLRTLLATSGEELAAHFAAADLTAPASVAWMGPEPVPAWLDIARHYTERWVHQQQVRAAVGRPGLDGDRHLGAVLRTFVWALATVPPAPPGTEVGFSVTGPGGGDWTLRAGPVSWDLEEGAPRVSTATVSLPSDAAWRLFTDALRDESSIAMSGDPELAGRLVQARAIIV